MRVRQDPSLLKEKTMGSMSRMTRCDRFRKKLEDKIVAKSPFQKGDCLEVQSVGVGMDEGAEFSKLYVLVRNSRTGNEEEVTLDQCLFDPEGMDGDNVSRLDDHLFARGSDKENSLNRRKVIVLLKNAELIDSEYKEKS
jgi:hypothetical protein